MADADLSKVKTIYVVHSDASKYAARANIAMALEKIGKLGF